MKRIFLAAAILPLFCSCEKTVLLDDGNQKSLILNAMLSTADTLHTAFLSYGTMDKVIPVSDGFLECYVNGELSSSASLVPGNRNWQAIHFKANIKPSDDVRLVASTSEGYRVEANATAPEAAVLSSAEFDTISLKLPEDKDTLLYSRIRATVQDIKDKDSWYRIQVKWKSATILTAVGEYSDYPAEKIGKVIASEYGTCRMSNYTDPLLYKGISLSKKEDMSENNYFSNTLNIFSDEYFRDGEYVLSLLPYYFDLYASPGTATSGDRFLGNSEIIVRLSTMDRRTFNYLDAVQLERSDAGGTYLISPYPFPSNVEGGLGFFTIFSDYDYVYKLPSKEFAY